MLSVKILIDIFISSFYSILNININQVGAFLCDINVIYQLCKTMCVKLHYYSLLNIVIFYVRLANGCIVPLPKHHIDTGMGLERLVTFLQGKSSNYDTDLFQPLFSAIQKNSNAPEYKGMFGDDDTSKIDYGYRILADHARMVTVALADNMLPEQQYVFSVTRNFMV